MYYKYISEDNTRNSYNYIMKELDMKEPKFKVGDEVTVKHSGISFVIDCIVTSPSLGCNRYGSDEGANYLESQIIHKSPFGKPKVDLLNNGEFHSTFDVIEDTKPKHYRTKSGRDVTDFVYDYNIEPCGAIASKYIARKGKKQYPNMTLLESEKRDIYKAIDMLQRRLGQIKEESK